MKHWSRLAALAVVSVLLFACSETPVPDNQGVEWVALKLRVAPTFEVSTRAISTDVQDNSFEDGTEIGVFILDDDGNRFATATGSEFSSHSYLKYENLKYTYSADDGSLTFADDLSDRDMREGPMLVKNSRIVVIAYAPYQPEMTYEQAGMTYEQAGMTYEKLMVTPQITISDSQVDKAGIKASDFILGTPRDYRNSFVYDGETPVTLSMRHQLSRIVLKFTPASLLEIINADKSDKLSSLTVSSLTVKAKNVPKSTSSAVRLDDAKKNYVFPADGYILGEVVMAEYTNKVLLASDNTDMEATAIVLPYTYSANSDEKPRFKIEIEYVVNGETNTKSISLSLRNANQDITLGRGESRDFILKNPDSFSPGSDDNNSVLDNLYVDDADGNMVDNNNDVW